MKDSKWEDPLFKRAFFSEVLGINKPEFDANIRISVSNCYGYRLLLTPKTQDQKLVHRYLKHIFSYKHTSELIDNGCDRYAFDTSRFTYYRDSIFQRNQWSQRVHVFKFTDTSLDKTLGYHTCFLYVDSTYGLPIYLRIEWYHNLSNVASYGLLYKVEELILGNILVEEKKNSNRPHVMM